MKAVVWLSQARKAVATLLGGQLLWALPVTTEHSISRTQVWQQAFIWVLSWVVYAVANDPKIKEVLAKTGLDTPLATVEQGLRQGSVKTLPQPPAYAPGTLSTPVTVMKAPESGHVDVDVVS